MMNRENLYQTIFKRKSVRKYDFTPLDENTLAEISARLRSLKPLHDNIKTEIKIISQNDIKSIQPIKAPHYIVVFSEAKDGYLTNAGFMLQQMDLFLSANGIGSCWMGLPRPTKEILNKSDLKFVIILAFGKPAESLHRESIAEFKRKPFEQIRSIVGADELLEPARLAPSATNSQPWFFTGGDGIIHAYCVKSNFLKALIYEKMNRIDMGIAICHIWLTAEQFGKKVEFVMDKSAQDNPPAMYYYISSLQLNP